MIKNLHMYQVFLRRFRDPIRVPRIRENYHWVPKIRENQVPTIREIGSLHIHTGYLTFSFKKNLHVSSLNKQAFNNFIELTNKLVLYIYILKFKQTSFQTQSKLCSSNLEELCQKQYNMKTKNCCI